jgi:hypothetical protein
MEPRISRLELVLLVRISPFFRASSSHFCLSMFLISSSEPDTRVLMPVLTAAVLEVNEKGDVVSSCTFPSPMFLAYAAVSSSGANVSSWAGITRACGADLQLVVTLYTSAEPSSNFFPAWDVNTLQIAARVLNYGFSNPGNFLQLRLRYLLPGALAISSSNASTYYSRPQIVSFVLSNLTTANDVWINSTVLMSALQLSNQSAALPWEFPTLLSVYNNGTELGLAVPSFSSLVCKQHNLSGAATFLSRSLVSLTFFISLLTDAALGLHSVLHTA